MYKVTLRKRNEESLRNVNRKRENTLRIRNGTWMIFCLFAGGEPPLPFTITIYRLQWPLLWAAQKETRTNGKN